jgi:hypothetical protein
MKIRTACEKFNSGKTKTAAGLISLLMLFNLTFVNYMACRDTEIANSVKISRGALGDLNVFAGITNLFILKIKAAPSKHDSKKREHEKSKKNKESNKAAAYNLTLKSNTEIKSKTVNAAAGGTELSIRPAIFLLIFLLAERTFWLGYMLSWLGLLHKKDAMTAATINERIIKIQNAIFPVSGNIVFFYLYRNVVCR